MKKPFHFLAKKLKGFTLFEMAVVLVIIGILSGFIIAKYFDLSPNAKQGATNSVAAALNTASMLNYQFYKFGSAKAKSINNCTDVINTLPSDQALPAGYTITSQAIAPDATATCVVVNSDGLTTSTFIGRGTA